MAFELPLPSALKKAGWKVKIRDKESREPPHVTLIRGARAWRINLRTGEFMDAQPPSKDVPKDLLRHVEDSWEQLCAEWEQMYPDNPVSSDEE